LIDYSDADWGRDADQSKSTSGYAFLFNDSAILWKSKKQSCITLSIMEAKYIACFAATQDVIWLKSFIYHYQINIDSVTIYCDNIVAVTMAKDSKYYEKTKHIKMRYQYIREAIIEHNVILKHISTNSMVGNLLTKPIARDVFVRHVRFIGLCRM
jgi:hypothetical protein